jgi:hypothetical protein
MPADMADLPEFLGTYNLNASQRRHAALSVAERFGGDQHRLAYYLVELGLADHQEDGTFTAHEERDGGTWFSPRHDGARRAAFALPVGQLDDCR